MSLNVNQNFVTSFRARPPKLDELMACLVTIDELKDRFKDNHIAIDHIEKVEQKLLSDDTSKDDNNSNIQLLSELKD